MKLMRVRERLQILQAQYNEAVQEGKHDAAVILLEEMAEIHALLNCKKPDECQTACERECQTACERECQATP